MGDPVQELATMQRAHEEMCQQCLRWLEKYGGHLVGCSWTGKNGRCTCGYQMVLDGVRTVVHGD